MELALKWRREFQNHLEEFCVSCRGGGEYLSSSQWWQRIAVLLELSTILLFQSIFFKCNLVETRQSSQKSDTTWNMAGEISKSISRTYGGKKFFSDLTCKKQSPINSCGLLVPLLPIQGRRLPLEAPLSWRQLPGACTDVNLAQHGHKLALISCLSTKIQTILCFLQENWKWKILHSLVA